MQQPKMKCGDCLYMKKLDGEDDALNKHAHYECRRKSPSLGGWPSVYTDDGCGDFSPTDGWIEFETKYFKSLEEKEKKKAPKGVVYCPCGESSTTSQTYIECPNCTRKYRAVDNGDGLVGVCEL